MAKRLVIDLRKCDACETCGVACAYFYRPSDTDHGILSIRELATYALVCRRCEEPSCVAACKFEALERQEDGVLKRHNLRCVSCKCCAHACPFGTIYPDALPLAVTRCDYCLGGGTKKDPPCVASCSQGALSFREVRKNEKNMTILNKHLAARAPAWDRENV